MLIHGHTYITLPELTARLAILALEDYTSGGPSDGRETERNLILDTLKCFTWDHRVTHQLFENALYLAHHAAPVLPILQEIGIVTHNARLHLDNYAAPAPV